MRLLMLAAAATLLTAAASPPIAHAAALSLCGHGKRRRVEGTVMGGVGTATFRRIEVRIMQTRKGPTPAGRQELMTARRRISTQ